LKEKALDFDKRNRSRTYLIIDAETEDDIIILARLSQIEKTTPKKHW
jgi:hypothetical protein